MNKNNKHEKENDYIQERKNHILTERELELKTKTTMGPIGPMGPPQGSPTQEPMQDPPGLPKTPQGPTKGPTKNPKGAP